MPHVSSVGLVAGCLPAYAWPGGYPLFYLDGENSVLCPTCADQSRHDMVESFRPVAVDVNWEDEDMHCDQCSRPIECAYPQEPEVDPDPPAYPGDCWTEPRR